MFFVTPFAINKMNKVNTFFSRVISVDPVKENLAYVRYTFQIYYEIKFFICESQNMYLKISIITYKLFVCIKDFIYKG